MIVYVITQDDTYTIMNPVGSLVSSPVNTDPGMTPYSLAQRYGSDVTVSDWDHSRVNTHSNGHQNRAVVMTNPSAYMVEDEERYVKGVF